MTRAQACLLEKQAGLLVQAAAKCQQLSEEAASVACSMMAAEHQAGRGEEVRRVLLPVHLWRLRPGQASGEQLKQMTV